MMKFYMVLLSTFLMLASCEVCIEEEMVCNGNFSQPAIFAPWTNVAQIPGGHGTWMTVPPNNGFQLWQQGTMGSPVNGVDGAPTGQHLEINGNEPWAQITYEFNTPCLLGGMQATYSFEYWYNTGCGCDTLGFTIEQQGKYLVQESYEEERNGWMGAEGSFSLMACQPIKLTFTSSAQGNGGVNIDNVSLKVEVCKDVEMVSGGLFDSPVISNPWEKVSQIPGGEGIWSTTSAYILWQQGAMGSPAKDTNGNFVGQFLEINGASTKAQIGYKFFVPYMLGTAKSTVSFLYWIREAGDTCECSTVNYFGYSIEQGGQVVKSSALSTVESGWISYSESFDLEPQLPAHLYFTTDTVKIGGVYIDAISLTITEYGQVSCQATGDQQGQLPNN